MGGAWPESFETPGGGYRAFVEDWGTWHRVVVARRGGGGYTVAASFFRRTRDDALMMLEIVGDMVGETFEPIGPEIR